MTKPNPSIALNVGQCPIDSVTVYNGSAEVTRNIKATVVQGLQELVLRGLSANADPGSLRVYAEQNHITILEVTSNSRSEDVGSNTLHIKEALQLLHQEKIKLLDREKAILKSREFLESYAKKLSEKQHDTKENIETNDLLKDSSLRGLHEFINVYTSKMEVYDYDIEFLQKRLREVEKRIKELQGKSGEEPSTEATANIVYDISVLLQAKSQSGEVNLKFAYLISKCSWSPSYDIRAKSQDITKIGLTYYGVILNNSGDDWNKAKIMLSTSQPSINGAPPTLNPQTVQFSTTLQPGKVVSKKREKERRNSKADETEEEMHLIVATDTEQSINGMLFVIPRIASIVSGNKPHKVAISMIDLDATFIFSTVPRLQAKAYLKAAVTNSSDCSLLAGPALMFFDNSYVSTMSLKDVPPQEKFEVFMGVDPTLHIEYKPVQKVREQGGLISKVQSQTFTHKTIIKNLKQLEVEIFVKDFYPKPVDEKIKIRLLDPQQEESSTHKATDYNLEWKLKIPGGTTEELTYSYVVEWPLDREIDSFLAA